MFERWYRGVQWGLRYVPTNEQITDVLMKPLGRGKLVYFQDRLGVMENVSLAESKC